MPIGGALGDAGDDLAAEKAATRMQQRGERAARSTESRATGQSRSTISTKPNASTAAEFHWAR